MRHRGEPDLEEYRRSVGMLVKKWIATCAAIPKSQDVSIQSLAAA